MGRFRWPLLVFVLCLPVVVLAAGYDLPWLRGPAPFARTKSVPSEDREVAWLHTTTNAHTWERFVSGVQRTTLLVPGMRVDDSYAFPERTTAVPEVVVRMDGRAGALRIRWYKLSSYAKASHWVQALASRNPAPLAVIGGGSSDRARELAWAMARQTTWRGDKPVLLITTATAERVESEPGEAADRTDALGQLPLNRIYDGRTLRFCFGNRQMAVAMLDFVAARPDLRPQLASHVVPLAVASGLAAGTMPRTKPTVLTVDWDDDPYSSDLLNQFQEVLPRSFPGGQAASRWQVPFSVGGFYLPNRAEAEAADSILRELGRLPPQRSILVLPTIPAPARRLLRTLCDADPRFGEQVVVVNGDGIQVNSLLRDGEFAWPVNALPVPLVLFTHHDPAAWDPPGAVAPLGYELIPPSSTEDVLHFAELTRGLVEGAYADSGLVRGGDELLSRMNPPNGTYFNTQGSRRGGTGEYVCLFRPAPAGPGGGLPDAVLEVYRRAAGRWAMTRSVPVHQSRAGGQVP